MSGRPSWRALEDIGTWAVVPALLAMAVYVISGATDLGPRSCQVLGALPPLAATAAGIVLLPNRRARRIAVSFSASLLTYSVPVALVLFFLSPSNENSLTWPLSVLLRLLRFTTGAGVFVALFAGGGLVGLQTAVGVHRLLRSRRSVRGVRQGSRAGIGEAECSEEVACVERRVRWVGTAVGVMGVASLFLRAPIIDSMGVMLLYPLTLGAWLSAIVVVLIMGPNSPAPDA